MSKQTLTYEVSLPTSPSPDVVKLVATIAEVLADGQPVPTVVKDIPLPLAANFLQVTVTEGSSVAISVVAIDDAGNTSLPKSISFTATDTIPPVLEGDLTVTAVSEQLAEDPAPVTPTDPAPVDPVTPTPTPAPADPTTGKTA